MPFKISPGVSATETSWHPRFNYTYILNEAYRFSEKYRHRDFSMDYWIARVAWCTGVAKFPEGWDDFVIRDILDTE